MAGITVENVRKAFGAFEALKSVSLEVKPQEFTVLLGASGCGKSTLLRIIAGLETETSGVIKIGERRVNGMPPRDRRIAMVFQNYAVFPHMTVFDNIAFGLRMKKAPEDQIKQKVEKAATLMHIEQQLPKYSGQLSGGQRQRVAVARALAVEPEVLLMDEPLSNLDALLRMEMRAELKGLLAESKTTTIYVTHDQVEAMSLADRIAVMHQGEIVQYDNPTTVYHRPATLFVGGFLGNPPMNFLELDAAGEVGGVRFKPPPQGAGKAMLGIRPEDIEIVGEKTGDAMRADVKVVELLGATSQLTTRIDGQMVRVTADSNIGVRHGDSLWLRPNPERVRWYDQQSGHALPV
jgi:multiple sugar transport system ATP-binding protein